MGVLRSIFTAFLGPLVIYFLILGHVVYHVGFKEPEPLKVPQWPSSTKVEDKQAIIAARKPILREFMDFLGGKNAEFFKKHATEDIDWEDPIERIKGFDEMDGFAKLATRWIKESEIDVISENHSPHEIIMDWKIKTTVSFLPNNPMSINMRTHIMMEPSEVKVGGPEKVFRIYEEWGGNVLLTEKTCQPPILGKLHSKLRQFTGYCVTQLIKYGIL